MTRHRGVEHLQLSPAHDAGGLSASGEVGRPFWAGWLTVGLVREGRGEDNDRPTARGYLTAVGAIGICFALTLIALPFVAQPLPEIPGIMPFLSAVVLTTDLSTGFLLLVLFRELRKPSLLVLACAYLFAAAVAALNVATFPGVLARGAIVWGSTQSYPWITQVFWTGYAALCAAAMLVECVMPAKPMEQAAARRAIAVGLTLTLLVVWSLGEMTIRFVDLLPPVSQALPPSPVCARPLVNGSCPAEMVPTAATLLMRYASFAMMLLTVGMGVWIAGRRSQMFLWFTVAIACALSINVLSTVSGTRYSLGWTLGRLGWMASSCILFMFFMGRFAGQLRLLARAKEFLEQRVQERTAALAASLRERDLLLREVYHRVKNNMQVVDSMLFIERRRTSEPATRELIDVLQRRFAALGLVHRQLMASDNLEHFDIAPFVGELVRNISASEGITDRAIGLTVRCEPAQVNLDFAIPLGLVVTELVTNSLKHANARQISVQFRRSDGGNAMLSVQDDGVGRAGAAAGQAVMETPGQGSLIIAGLVAQLAGRMEVTSDGGMRVDVVMPLPERGQPA